MKQVEENCLEQHEYYAGASHNKTKQQSLEITFVSTSIAVHSALRRLRCPRRLPTGGNHFDLESEDEWHKANI